MSETEAQFSINEGYPQFSLDTQLSTLYEELSRVYRTDPRAYAVIGAYWYEIDMLEDTKRYIEKHPEESRED